MASLTLIKEPSSAFTLARDYWSRGLVWLTKGSLAILDQGLISGSNFLIGILLARWLVPENYGAYALALSIFLFLSGFHNALLLEPMSVFGPASYADRLPEYVGRLFGLHFALVFALSALIGLAIPILHLFPAGQALAPALWGVCVATPFVLFFWLCRRAAYLKLEPRLAARAASVYCLVVASLLLLARHFGWLSNFTAFVIQSLAAMAAAVVLVVCLGPRLDSRSGPSTSTIVRQHWRYGRWAVGTQFVYWLSGNAYYVIAAAFLRMQDLAALRALQNFSLPFGQFLSAISLLALPWASARYAAEGGFGFKRRIRQMALLFVGFASAYYVLLCLFGRTIIGLVYAGRYTEFAHLLPLVAAPLVILAASQGSMIAIQAMQSPANIFFSYAVAAVVTVAAGVPLTRYGGLAGATLGIVLSYLAFWVVIRGRCRARLRELFGARPNRCCDQVAAAKSTTSAQLS